MIKQITLKFPPDAPIVVIGGIATTTDRGVFESAPQWHRNGVGDIVATYSRKPVFDDWTYDELDLCMKMLEWSDVIRAARKERDKIQTREAAMARFGQKSGAAF